MKEVGSSYLSFEKNRDVKSLRQLVKQETGLQVRRMDSFTLIALLAVYRAKGDIELSAKSALYSCADYFSSDSMQSMLIDVHQNNPIKPLSFVASVGNAANYYIANTYAIDGPNIFIGSSKQAIEKNKLLAETDMSLGLIEHAILLVWQEDENQRECWAKIIQDDDFFGERGVI